MPNGFQSSKDNTESKEFVIFSGLFLQIEAGDEAGTSSVYLVWYGWVIGKVYKVGGGWFQLGALFNVGEGLIWLRICIAI